MIHLMSLLGESSALNLHRLGTSHYLRRWRHSSLTHSTVNHAVILFQEPNIIQITGEYMRHQHSENWRNHHKSAYYQWYIYGWFTVQPFALIKLYGLFYLYQLPWVTSILLFNEWFPLWLYHHYLTCQGNQWSFVEFKTQTIPITCFL